jgi:hypothetical protein
MRIETDNKKRVYTPANEFVEHVNVLLYLLHLGGILGVEDGEGRFGCAILDVGSAWLDEAADEDDLEKSICIFEELESGACLD